MSDLAKKLIDIEAGLNKHPTVFSLGSLIADYWRLVYNGSKKHRNPGMLYSGAAVLKYIFRFLILPKRSLNPPSTLVLFGKSGDKTHHNRLMDYLAEEFHDSSLFVDKRYQTCIQSLTIKEKISILMTLLKSFFSLYREIKKQSNATGVPFYKSALLSSLAIELIKFFAAKRYLQKFTTARLVVVDYDRSTFSALVLAANAVRIRTVSLQHGAINPPYGYIPLIAREIWVWGSKWQMTLSAMGVPPQSIRVVGSTIVYNNSSTVPPNHIKTVGIGPNPIGDNENFALWNEFSSMLSKLDYKVVVKLHPSMKRNAITSNNFGTHAEIFESAELSNDEFFQRIDLLIVSNSGLGYEAVFYNRLVAVKRQSNSFGNDYMMITDGKFPELQAIPELGNKLLVIEENYSTLLQMELDYVHRNIYNKTGMEAMEETKLQIKRYLYELADEQDT